VSPTQQDSPATDIDPNGIDQVVADLNQTESNRFVGFQTELPIHAAQLDAQSAQAQLIAAAPTPPPKRPKGRLLVGTFLMVLLSAGAYMIWDSAFRFHAYGQVEARRISVPVLTSGIVQRIYVAEGDKVRVGDLLAVINNVDLEHRLHRTRNDLRLAEAQLDALMTRLRRDSRFSQKAQSEMIRMLEQAVEKLKQRTNTDSGNLGAPVDIVRPALIRIENVKEELVRLQELIQATEIRAPIGGVVVKRSFLTGNWVEAGQNVLEIVEEASLELVIYLSQESTSTLKVGSPYEVFVEPHSSPLACVVKRIGYEFGPPPIGIERYYNKNERLLPVALEPQSQIYLRPGSLIKVPRAIDRFQFSF
jgi:multidrug resistance efflux pump